MSDGIDDDLADHALELIESRVLGTKCWVCQAQDWHIVRNNRSFGVSWTALLKDFAGPSPEESLRVIVLLCGSCGTLWPLGLTHVLTTYKKAAPEEEKEG